VRRRQRIARWLWVGQAQPWWARHPTERPLHAAGATGANPTARAPRSNVKRSSERREHRRDVRRGLLHDVPDHSPTTMHDEHDSKANDRCSSRMAPHRERAASRLWLGARPPPRFSACTETPSSLACSRLSSASPPSIAEEPRRHRHRRAVSTRTPRRHRRTRTRPKEKAKPLLTRHLPPRGRQALARPPRKRRLPATGRRAQKTSTAICSRCGACAPLVRPSPCASRACTLVPSRRARRRRAASRATGRPSASRSPPLAVECPAEARPASPGWSAAMRAAGSARLPTASAPSKCASDPAPGVGLPVDYIDRPGARRRRASGHVYASHAAARRTETSDDG